MATRNKLGFVAGYAMAIVASIFISSTAQAESTGCSSLQNPRCLLEAALEHIDTLSDPTTAVPYRAWIAQLYAKSGERKKAARLFDEAKQKAKSVAPPEHQISLLKHIASHQAQGGLGADAHATLIDAADIAISNLKEPGHWIGTVGPIVGAMVENGERGEAADLLRSAMERIGQTGDPGERASHLTLTASIATRNGIPEIAEASLTRAWSDSRKIDDTETRLAHGLGVAEERMRAGLITQAKADLKTLLAEGEGSTRVRTREALLATIKIHLYQIATGICVSDF